MQSDRNNKKPGDRTLLHLLGNESVFDIGRWRIPILQLRALAAQCYASTVIWHKRNREHPQRWDPGIITLAHLCSNSCRVTGEIVTLLAAGYPDGATARWRTLHEIGVVLKILWQGGPAVARRYADYAVIQEYKQMTRLKEKYEERKTPPPESFIETYENATKHREAIIEKYGKGFEKEGGWVISPEEGKQNQRTTFAEMEKQVRSEKMRAAYAHASEQIHAGSDSIRWDAEPGKRGSHEILFGPSANGLAVPGLLTAVTIGDILSLWERANWTDNPFLSKDKLQKDIEKIWHRVEEAIDLFIQCEHDPRHLAHAGIQMSFVLGGELPDHLVYGSGKGPSDF